MSDIIEKIKKNVIEGRVDIEDEGFDGNMIGQPGVLELVKQALEENTPPSDILNKAVSPGMDEVGRLYESGKYLIPDMLASAECVSEATKILKPLLLEGDTRSRGKFVIATVEDDLHDIGKNIVTTLLRGAGFEVQDLGAGVTADKIVNAIEKSQSKYLGLSALLTTTMGHMEEVIDLLKEKGIRDQVIVCVGGAPVSEDFAHKIGANLYGEDAFDVIAKLENITQ